MEMSRAQGVPIEAVGLAIVDNNGDIAGRGGL